MFSKINKTLIEAETKLNIAGGIPFLCIGSGAVRALAGVIQTIAGAILGTVGTVGKIFSEDKKKWHVVQQAGREYMIHGALNTLRGIGECTLGIFSFGWINCVLLAEQAHQDHFGPQYAYQV